MKKVMAIAAAALLTSGCTSVGTLGIVTRSSSDPGMLLKNATNYSEIGRVEGEACRFFLLNVIPLGDSTFSSAVEEALTKSGGDALVNVTVSSSLYGFIPLYNICAYTCTNVKGVAIKLEKKS